MKRLSRQDKTTIKILIEGERGEFSQLGEILIFYNENFVSDQHSTIIYHRQLITVADKHLVEVISTQTREEIATILRHSSRTTTE